MKHDECVCPSETRDPDWISDPARKCPEAHPSSLPPSSRPLESPSPGGADDPWDQIERTTTAFVDETGERWAAKPGYAVRPFMQTIYVEAHRRAGEKLGVQTRSLIRNEIHMVPFADLRLFRQRAFAMGMNELEDIFEEQRWTLAAYLVACRLMTREGGDCRRWVEAYVRVTTIIGLSSTLQEACERLMYIAASEEGISRYTIEKVRASLSESSPLSEATLASALYNQILDAARNDARIRAAFLSAASTGNTKPLSELPREFAGIMTWHATHTKVVNRDELDVSLPAILISLAQQVTSDLSENRHLEFSRKSGELPGKIIPESARLQRCLSLALMAERLRKDAPHLRALGHRIVQLRMAPLVDALMRNGRVQTCAEVLARTPDWWIQYAVQSGVATEKTG